MQTEPTPSDESIAHHPAILQVLQRVPEAEARALRLYMDMLLQAVETFSQRGRAILAERDALLEMLHTLAELGEFIEAETPAPTKADAVRQTEALLATVRKKARGPKPD